MGGGVGYNLKLGCMGKGGRYSMKVGSGGGGGYAVQFVIEKVLYRRGIPAISVFPSVLELFFIPG